MWQNVKKISGHKSGYTIIEVMVVLAVTSALFVAIVGSFSGRQGRTEFATAAREVESRIQDIMNDTSTGYYPSNGKQCTNSGGVPTFGLATSQQGTNGECIFVGRVIQFRVGSTNDSEYRVFSVAGVRQKNGVDVANITDANPKAIDGPDSSTFPGGIKIGNVTYNNGGADVPVAGIGFFSTFDATNGSNYQKSGTTSVNLMTLGENATPSESEMASNYINQLGGNSIATVTNPSNGIKVCLISAGSNQVAILTIGGGKKTASTNLEIRSGPC